jgi:endonuclease G
MIPQDPENNRKLWAKIESDVRDLAIETGELYVVTGPIFTGENVQSLKGRVLIPTQIYKAVYVPKQRGAGAYLAENAPGKEVRVVSLAELQRVTGIDPFPTLPQSVKDDTMMLPIPQRGRRRPETVAGRPPAQEDPPTTGGLVETILDDIDRVGHRR